MDKNKRFELGTWLPAIFCFFLAAMQAAMGLGQLSAAYLWFLPICFVYVGMGQLALHRRIAELEARRAAPADVAMTAVGQRGRRHATERIARS